MPDPITVVAVDLFPVIETGFEAGGVGQSVLGSGVDSRGRIGAEKVDFIAIAEAVAIAVCQVAIGSIKGFVAIGKSVPIGIVEKVFDEDVIDRKAVTVGALADSEPRIGDCGGSLEGEGVNNGLVGVSRPSKRGEPS